MGNDGGSIPGRQELVKQKKQKKQLKRDLMAKARATICALSKEPLKHPIAACWLGFLFNKETLLEALVLKKLPQFYRSYITSMKDMKTVKVELRESPGQDSQLVCPITQQEFNGFHK